jgi:2-desacetyl-2-hydroxyethyl bacteriochlorophyllide A dehydrogenase
MKTIILEQPGRFICSETPFPAPPGAGEALVRVHRVGICGTDISGYLGKMPFFQYPRIPGHELGVEVLEVSPDVVNVKPGDRCSVEPYMNCGRCIACRKGAGNCCATLKVIGVMIDGGMRERFLIRADKLHPSPKLSFDQLALVETLAIGCHANQRGNAQRGENVLIIGAGPIGLATLEFVRLTGAKTIVLDVDEHRLRFCRDVMKADEILLLSDSIEADLRSATDGNLPDVVIDATGSNKSMSAAFGYVAPTGRLVFVGITTGEVTFKHPVFHRAEGTLLCSRNALPQDFTRIIKLIEDGGIDTGPWITHRATCETMIDQFPRFFDPSEKCIKAMIEFSNESADQGSADTRSASS